VSLDRQEKYLPKDTVSYPERFEYSAPLISIPFCNSYYRFHYLHIMN